MWCDSQVFLLARNLATPYLNRKLKATVATHYVLFEPLSFGKLVRFPLMIACSSSIISSCFYGVGGGCISKPRVTLSLHVGGVLTGVLSLQIGILVIVQVWAKCPDQRHFQHWFGRPEYRILCSIVSFMIAPSTMEGIRMYPANLPMSWVSTMIMGSVGLFMYESSSSISWTFPILLAMIVRAFVFLNCSWRSGNWTFIVWKSEVSAPCILVSKFIMYREKERFKPLHSTIVIFLADLTFFSFVKSTSKKALVSNVTDVYEAGRCSVATLLWPSVGVKPNTWKKRGFGVLRASRMFRARQQGPKHLALRCSWCHWKGLEA